MDNNNALKNLLNGTASEEEINLLKSGLASGEISIGGNVTNSVLVQGSENNVQVFQLTPEILELLGGRQFLGDLDRDLTGDEIAAGLSRLEAELPLRAPVLIAQLHEQTRRLRPSLKTNPKSLSDHSRKERVEVLTQVNRLCMEALDISFNALCLGEKPPEYDSRSPFRGLESFRLEDSEFFFGREALTKKLVDKINSNPFLAVLGASGSGKSSLVMAGLIPALSLEAKPFIFRPGTNPLEALEAAKGSTLVVVDQFEELFTLTRDETTRKEFVKKLLELSMKNRVIVTMRADFWGEIAVYKDLKQTMQDHQELIAPMDMDELSRAMEGQASQVGLRFEADLSQQILDDVKGEPGAMPLLQHALWELWNRRHGRNLRASEYRDFGGVKRAITSTAEKVYGECAQAEQGQIRDFFLRLTRLDDSDEGRDTRRRVTTSNLILLGSNTTSITLLLDKLANARLIVKTVNEDRTEIEVAHEALIRHWERLRDWLNEDRDNLRLRESVSENAREWEKAGRDEALLNHRGGRLELALAIRENLSYPLNLNEQSYLDACVKTRERDKAAIEKRKRAAVYGISIILLVLLGWGITSRNNAKQLAYQVATATSAQGIAQQQAATANAAKAAAVSEANVRATAQADAEAQAIISHAGELTAQAIALSEKDDVLSLLLSIDAFRTADNMQTRSTLLNIAETNLQRLQKLTGPTTPITSMALSPNGKYVATGGSDRIARIWNLDTGVETADITHENSVAILAFSPDNNFVASGSYESLIHIWTTGTGDLAASLNHDDWATALSFSPNGEYLATGSHDKTLRIWSMRTKKEVVRINHTDWVTAISFSPDSKYAATGDALGSIHIWEVPSGKEIASMDNGNWVTAIAFDPSGKYIVTGSKHGTIRVWDAATKKEIVTMAHNDKVSSVSFSQDGSLVLSASQDGTVRVWESTTGTEIIRKINNFPVIFAAFIPNSKFIISGSSNGYIYTWRWRPEDLISDSCSLLPRNMTRAEWKQYNGDSILYEAICPNLPIEAESTATP